MALAKYAEDNLEIYNERMASKEWYTFSYINTSYQKKNYRPEDKKDDNLKTQKA